MSAPNEGIAISSTVLTSIAEGGGTTTMSTTTTVSAPAVTRSLALEFDAELRLGYEWGQMGTTSSRAGFFLRIRDYAVSCYNSGSNNGFNRLNTRGRL
ncbi:hypothetical protein Hanom_Chr06g00538291 [Helianthus anomalus]